MARERNVWDEPLEDEVERQAVAMIEAIEEYLRKWAELEERHGP